MLKDLLARVRQNRRLILFLSAVLLAFELWRIIVARDIFLPLWRDAGDRIVAQASMPLWIAIPSLTVALLAFVIPLAGVIFALRFVHRKLSRFRTVR